MLGELPDFALEVYLGEWEFAARHHLTASDAQTLTVGELLALAGPERARQFEQLPLSYTPTWGTPTLLDAIAATYERLGPEHVLTFAGAEEAMFWALQELVGPGDHAVVTVPNYQSMESVTIATGADVDGLVLSPDDGWALDLDALAALLRPTTRLVCVNFPNNPTGALPSRETFTRLVALCDERGIRLFSDEVYRGLELDRATMLPQAAELSDTAISLNVMSKSYGLPGLRIGWLATRDRALLERLERRKHYTTIANSAPSEFLATIALGAGDQIQARNRAIIAANVPLLDAFFDAARRSLRLVTAAGRLRLLPAAARRRGRRAVLPAAGTASRRDPAARRDLCVGAGRCPPRALPDRRRPARHRGGAGRVRGVPRDAEPELKLKPPCEQPAGIVHDPAADHGRPRRVATVQHDEIGARARRQHAPGPLVAEHSRGRRGGGADRVDRRHAGRDQRGHRAVHRQHAAGERLRSIGERRAPITNEHRAARRGDARRPAARPPRSRR